MVNANFLFLQSVNYPLLKVNYLPTDIAWILSCFMLVPFKSLICFLNSAGTLHIDLSVHADILLDWKCFLCFYNILNGNFVQRVLRGPACANFMFLLFRFGLASVLIVILDVYVILDVLYLSQMNSSIVIMS
ncbi:hypothetical protein ACJX0J_017626 [Zea mays]